VKINPQSVDEDEGTEMKPPEPIISPSEEQEHSPEIPSEIIGAETGESDQPKRALKAEDGIRYRDPESNEWVPATIIGRAGKATGKYNKWYNVRSTDGVEKSVDLGQLQWEKLDSEEANVVLIPTVNQDNSECIDAKQAELQKLCDFGVYEEVNDTGQSCISTRWVMWQKASEVRARLVVRGFEEDTNVPKDSPTVGKSTVRVFLAIAANKGWTVKTTDIKSAFLQSQPLERDVFLTPPKEARVPPGRVWHLRKCLYGLKDAARQFYDSIVGELIKLDRKSVV
jgi:hypothetical protein